MLCDKDQINRFLKNFKSKMNDKFYLIERKEKRGIRSLGISIKTVKQIINSLTFEHYSEGPNQDENYPGYNVWIFGYNFAEKMIYIKLSDDFRYVAKCISFHIAEYEMKFPYK